MFSEPAVQKKPPNQAAKPNLTGIPDTLKREAETASGLSFHDVRVHYNSPKPASFGALAYTQGSQIHLGRGQESCLRHELGHVMQQKQGRVRPTGKLGGQPVNTDPALEHEADVWPKTHAETSRYIGVTQLQKLGDSSKLLVNRQRDTLKSEIQDWNTGMQAHHIIPSDVFHKCLAPLESSVNESWNGIMLPSTDVIYKTEERRASKPIHQGYHINYSNRVEEAVNCLKATVPAPTLLSFQLLAALLRNAIRTAGPCNIDEVSFDPQNLAAIIQQSFSPVSNTQQALTEYNEQLCTAAAEGLTAFTLSNKFTLFLQQLTTAKIRQFATGLQMDLGGATKKADMIQAITNLVTAYPLALPEISFNAANEYYYEHFGHTHLLLKGERILTRTMTANIIDVYRERVFKDGAIYMRILLQQFA